MRCGKAGLWTLLAVAGAAAALVTVADAGQWKTLDNDRWCRESRSGDDESACEIREITIPADRAVIRVDAGPNGGVDVEGWDRDEIQLTVKVKARVRDDGDAARELVGKIVVVTDDDVIHAEGPKHRRHQDWSVSFRLRVPSQSNLDLEATNGGLAVEGVEGKIRLETTNGGLSLSGVAGDVSGHTTNGGLHVELSGKKWRGAGLDVLSTNGGIDLEIPEHYSAELETGTVNGSIELDFPITVQGRIGRSLRATLGDGGPPIRVRTTNGGVRIYHD